MNLRVTHGAGLIFRRLIVHGAGRTARGQRAREGVALQTKHIHRHDIEQFGVGGTVRRMATATPLSFYRHVFVDEWTLLVDVALVANRIAAGQRLELPHRSRPVRIVAVHALD